MSKNVKKSNGHNKKRNTALLYEMMVRHISHCLIENKQEEANKTLDICKRYFANNTLLGQELKLFKEIASSEFKNRDSAVRLLENVYKSSSALDVRQLDVAKSKLIKEINYNLSKDKLYNHRIPNYVVYASLSTLINENRVKRKSLNNVEKVYLEDVVIEHILKEKTQPSKEVTVQKSKDANTVQKIVVERFEKKYSSLLSEDQRKLLTQFAIHTLNSEKSDFLKTVNEEVKRVKNVLDFPRNIKDGELLGKIKEAKILFANKDFSVVNEENVKTLLEFMSLAGELNSNE